MLRRYSNFCVNWLYSGSCHYKTLILFTRLHLQVAEICSSQPALKLKTSGDAESEHSELPPFADPEVNVYSFGILLLEIISGKLPYSEEQGPLEKWVCSG